MQNAYQLKSEVSFDTLMNTFLHSSAHTGDSAREIWLSRQTLLSLMRLVKSTQLLDIRKSARQLVPADLMLRPVRGTRSKRLTGGQPGQTQFVFGGDN